jgi:phage/plasmid-like protein (TIGR03299 family)
MAHEIEIRNGIACFARADHTPPAWHNLGQVAPGNAYDLMWAAQCLDTVESKPLFLADGTAVPNLYAIQRKDGKILGNCSGKRAHAQPRVIVDFVDALQNAGLVAADTAMSLYEGTKVVVNCTVLDHGKPLEASIGTSSDTIKGNLTVCQGYDGSMGFLAVSSATRVVCNNTLRVALGESTYKRRARHVGDLEAKIDRIRDEVQRMLTGFDKTVQIYRDLASKQTTVEEFQGWMRELFPTIKPQDEAKRASPLLNRLTAYYESGIGQDLKGAQGTRWGAYNAVTQYLSHDRAPGIAAADKEAVELSELCLEMLSR